MAKERKPRRKEKPGRISRINLGRAWDPYDGDQVARDMSERRRKTIAHHVPPSSPKQYQEMLSWIGVLEILITEFPKQRRGIGHNIQPITNEDLEQIEQAVTILKAPLPKAPHPPDKAQAAASTLKKIGERLGTYLDACLLEASKEVGKRLAQTCIGGRSTMR